MDNISLENKFLKVRVKLFGAELTSVFDKETHTEYMYQPDGIHWNKQSPILFPNIGAIRNNSFSYLQITVQFFEILLLALHILSREEIINP